MPVWLLTAWAFVTEHQTIMSAVAVANLDLLFAIKPEWKSNGILHMIYLKVGPKQPPTE